MTQRSAVATVYLSLEMQDELDWEDFTDSIRCIVKRKYPSMEDCDTWAQRECHGIARNRHATVFISGYNGVIAVELVPEDEGMSVAWAGRIADGFEKAIGKAYPESVMYSQGRCSNGEQIFTLAGQPGSCVTSKEGRLW